MIGKTIKCRVIEVPSTKNGYDAGDLCKRIKKCDLFPVEEVGYMCIAKTTRFSPSEHFQSFNIHIISPEKFKMGDFVYDYAKAKVGRFNGTVTDGGDFSDHCWKIAATTSDAIRINSTIGTVGKIPPAFIEEYVACDGAITDIEVQACVTGKDVYNDFTTNEIIILKPTKNAVKITRGMQGYSHGDFEDEIDTINTDNVNNAAIRYCTKSELAEINDGSWDVAENAFKAGADWAFALMAQQAAEKPSQFGDTDVLEVTQQRYGGGREAMRRRLDFINGSTWQQERYLKATENALIPAESYGHDVFAIKDGEHGKEAFIGYFLPNGNFHFVSVPYTEKK